MRVRLVVGQDAPDRDGVAAYAHRLAGALNGAGAADVDVIGWPGLRGWPSSTRGYDVVHVQFAPAAYGYSGSVGITPALTRIPLVTTLHEYGWWSWQPALRPLWWAAERLRAWDRETLLLTRCSSELVATGHAHAGALRRRTGRRAEVIPIATNVDAAYAGDRLSARRALGLPPDAPVLVFFGFVHPVKGLPYLFSAVAQLRQRWPDLQLLVVGGWRSLAWPDAEADAFADDLRARLSRLELAEATRLTGYLPDDEVSRHLRAADIGVLPFTAGVGPKSGSLLACWSHGLPVVATIGGDSDRVVTGAVEPCRPRDAASLAAAIANLLEQPDLAAELADAGQAQLVERTWPAIAEAHLRVYRRATSRR